jgi:putative SOS response-associated peptidase YedK
MCGRFTLRARVQDIREEFALKRAIELAERYNIAPTQQISAVRQGADGERELVSLKWGLIPSWAKDDKIAYSTINARAETVVDKPAFRSAFKRRRCLIPADGWYEWKVTGGTKSKPTKQPYRMHRPDDRPFGMAGLWERWEHGGKAIESCTIIVTSANARLSSIHDRMPCIISHDDYGLWLDPEFEGRDKLLGLLRPSPDEAFESYPVSTAVGNVRNTGADCIEPV